MTTATQAYNIIRGVIEAGMTIPLRWQNEDADSDGQVALPDVPAPFIYGEFITEQTEIAGFGGGRMSNLYRNRGRLDLYIFVPRGAGLTFALDYAEQAAALLRSYRDSSVSCFGATVYPGGDGAALQPPGLASEVNAYFWAACEIEVQFDQVG